MKICYNNAHEADQHVHLRFSTLIGKGCVYVDKTAQIYELVKTSIFSAFNNPKDLSLDARAALAGEARFSFVY